MTTWDEELDEIFGPVGQPGYAEARLAFEIAVQFTALRERRGLTQREVAERLGKTQQAVSKIENPSHGGHNLARLKEAVVALDATIDVTIIPLEDLAAYDALRPPKPTLEDIKRREETVQSDRDRSRTVRQTQKRGYVRVSSQPRPWENGMRLGTKPTELVRPSDWSPWSFPFTLGAQGSPGGKDA